MMKPHWLRTAVSWGAIALLTIGTGCAVMGDRVEPGGQVVESGGDMTRVRVWSLPAFSDDASPESLMVAGMASLEYYGRQPADRIYRFGRDLYSAAELKRFIEAFLAFSEKNPDAGQWRNYLREHARIYRGGGERGEMLFTGYYEPLLDGSRLPGAGYTVPIFGLPADLITVELGAFDPSLKGRRVVGRYQEGALLPYYTRHDIDRLGVLSGRGYEIAWVRDPVEAFFLHIQGSGKIVLPDGTIMNVQYAGNNGRPYRAVGRLLAEQKIIPLEEITARNIIKYFNDYPEEASNIMDYNERYIFFREAMTGPFGSIGVLLTPERSMATDAARYPAGALAYVETEVPYTSEDREGMAWKQTGRFVFNQDTGGAIKGASRGDLFFGTGPMAGDLAGEMKHPGRVYFLAPKKGNLSDSTPLRTPVLQPAPVGRGVD